MLKSFLLSILGLFVTFACPAGAAPRMEEWTDTQGSTFKGEPVEILGPIVLFRTGRSTGRRLPFRYLREVDALRIHRAIEAQAPRAEDFGAAKSDFSAELARNTQVVKDGKLVKAQLGGRPEPLFYLTFFARSSEGPSWGMMGAAAGPYAEMRTKYPGMVEAVFFGVQHSATDHLNMATSLNLPWLVAEYHTQSTLQVYRRFAPAEGYAMLVLSRHGVPLFSAANPDEKATTALIEDLVALLDLMRPENPKGWPDRLNFRRGLQKALFANGKTDPVLVGDPILPEGLRQRKIYRFEARLDVAADGSIAQVELKPEPTISEKISAQLSAALKRAAIVPAVENGQFVEGVYTYRFQTTP